MNTVKYLWSSALLCLSAMSLCGGTRAEDQSQPAAANSSLDEIVVTAQKRSEPLVQVPSSISVLTGADLERYGSSSLIDFGNSVPGLSVQSSGTPGQTTVVIRGISTGPNYTVAPLVGTYIDETPIGPSSSQVEANFYSPDLMPYDVERIEVIEGPQGTLYGASAMGGLLKYVLKAPDLENVTAQGPEPTFGPSTRVGAPGGGGLSRRRRRPSHHTDVLGVRVSGYQQSTPGYIDNIGIGRNDFNSDRQSGGRLVALWKPSDIFSLKAAAMLSDIRADGFAGGLVERDQQPARLRPLCPLDEATGRLYVSSEVFFVSGLGGFALCKPVERRELFIQSQQSRGGHQRI